MNEKQKEIQCPICKNTMEGGTLILGTDVGPLNFLVGFSVGSDGILKWKPNSKGTKAVIRGKNKKIPALRCSECMNITFKMD